VKGRREGIGRVITGSRNLDPEGRNEAKVDVGKKPEFRKVPGSFGRKYLVR